MRKSKNSIKYFAPKVAAKANEIQKEKHSKVRAANLFIQNKIYIG